MIPFVYMLRSEVRLENSRGACLVVCETPLNLVRVSHRGAQIIRLCDGTRTVQDIARAIQADEEHVFKLCRYFHKKGCLQLVGTGRRNYFPSISIIIPAKDHPDELLQCLASVFSQNYPKDKLEVIVIDDGSRDGALNPVSAFPCKLIRNARSRGPAFCRNQGAREANGEILAFLDSDCVAEPTWLSELAEYFQWNRMGGIGGYVDGCFEKTPLDRYEKTFSSLNMGKHVLYAANDSSTFYVPTCNFLVRKAAFHDTGGFRDALRVGEDVDFCWRMRRNGYDLLYAPSGSVKHKHRNKLAKMMKRRAEYGTSEALLYALHPDKKKSFQLPPLAALSLLSVCAAILLPSVIPLAVTAGCFALETGSKARKTAKLKIGIGKVVSSVFRSHLGFFYFAAFHVVRYYMLLLLLCGFALHSIGWVCFSMLMLASSVDYVLKRPRLAFPLFLFYYAMDHISYQAGVFLGCVRQGTFGSYVPRVVRRATDV